MGGFLSFDIDITFEDINQCDKTSGQIKVFLHTHKCHQESSEVIINVSSSPDENPIYSCTHKL